jgi:hypothetical protein
MGEVQVVGYHTCSRDNGISYIQSSAPFHSNPKRKQWLTNGYYFWTDSDHFAHKWGEDSYNGHYAIMKCLIVMDKGLLLDLVGNVEDRLYFEKLKEKFEAYLVQPEVQRGLDPKFRGKSPSVSGTIAFWRKQREKFANNGIFPTFPYVAIKAQEPPRNSDMRFVEGRREVLLGLTRQQLCLFREGCGYIKSKELVYPVSD